MYADQTINTNNQILKSQFGIPTTACMLNMHISLTSARYTGNVFTGVARSVFIKALLPYVRKKGNRAPCMH